MEMPEGWKTVMSFVNNAGNIATCDPNDDTVCSTADIEHALYIMREMSETLKLVRRTCKHYPNEVNTVLEKFKEWK